MILTEIFNNKHGTAMKKFFHSLWAVAALATVFVGCSKDEAESPANKPREISMSVIAGSELETSPESRTTLNDDNSISWETSGEFLRVFETAGETTSSSKSEEALIDAGKAVFNVSFTENTSATAFTYNAVYPESAWVTSNNTDANNMKLITPTNQLPTATSFDGDADLLIAYPEQRDAQPTELQVRFKRIVAVGKMTIKNLNTTESITSVEFIAPESKKVTGRSYVNLNEGTVTQYGYTNNAYNNVVMNYDASLEMQSGMTAYFTCFPFEILAGETFKVVVTTPSKIFTREVTIPDGRSLAFTEGHASVFSVDMSTATEEEIASSEIEDGDYVIMAYYTKDNIAGYYALSSVADGSRLSDVNVSYDNSGSINSNDDNIVWTIAQDVDSRYYTITNGPENYLKYASKGASTSSSVNYFLVEKQEDGTYTIDAKDNPDYGLRYNANSEFFAFYNSAPNVSMIGNFYIVPVSSKTALETPTDLATEVDGNMVLVGWKPVAGATSYTVSFEPATIEPRTIESTGEASYAETFPLDYATEYTVSVVANPADTENYKASAPATATFTTGENPNYQVYTMVGDDANLGEGQYIFAALNGTEYLAATSLEESKTYGYLPFAAVMVNENQIVSNTTNDAYAFTLEASDTPGQYYLKDTYGRYMYNSGSYNRFNVASSKDTDNTYLWTISMESDGTVSLKNVASGKWMQRDASYGTFGIYDTEKGARPYAFKLNDGSLVPPTPKPILAVSSENVAFAAAGESKEVTYTAENLGSNQVFAAVSGENASQFSATVGNGTVTVTAAENTETTAKTATLTLYIAASEGGEHLAEATVALTQAGVPSGESITYTETFSNFTKSSSSYSNNGSYTSTEIAGLSWTYANCALNTSNSKFILGKNNANSSLTTSNISDGVSEITINWNAPFSSDKLRILVYVNDNLVGTLDITATSGASGQETISGINVSGNAVIKITGAAKVGSKDNRPGITGISWKNNN